MAAASNFDDPVLAPVYRLKVSLQEVRPAVWRRLRVSGATTLRQLHTVLQLAMGWKDYHLYMFRIDGIEYGEPDPELPCASARSVTLVEAMPTKSVRCMYTYDFGDGWEHRITVEAIEPEAPAEAPICLDGRRACPPEDCGGVPGYARLLQALRDPADPEHEELVTWAGHDFDPERFDPEAVNRLLQRRRSLVPRAPKKARGRGSAHARREVPAAASFEPGLQPLPGLSQEESHLLADLVVAELTAQGLAPETVSPSAAERVIWSIHSRALSLGLRALAAERGIAIPAPLTGRRG